MISLFFSYSHADEALRDQLEKHLSALTRAGTIDTWHDRKIVAGDPLDATVMEQLEAANVVLLLISADFIGSDYCFGHEMTRALERHAAGSCVVIPVILRACDWKATPLGTLLAAPKDGKPITQWPDKDEAFLDVVQSVRTALKKVQGTAAAPSVRQPSVTASAPLAASGPRSSNLRVAKTFSDRDRDQFVIDSYNYISTFFENSLAELGSRHPELQGDFRRIDAERFTAVVYRAGKTETKCTVFLSRMFGSAGIGFSYDDSGRTSSYNEQLTPSNDDQSMFFTTMLTSNPHAHLSTAGGAEHLWAMFIDRLQ